MDAIKSMVCYLTGESCTAVQRAEPGRRKWHALSDADIAASWWATKHYANGVPYRFARAVEATLRERNT